MKHPARYAPPLLAGPSAWPAALPRSAATGRGHDRPGWQAGPLSRGAAPARPLIDEFIKGSLTTGLLAALQHRNGQPLLDRRTLRLALQGGAALAAGTAAVQAIRQARHGQALLAVAGGAVAVAAAEHFLTSDAPPLQEDHDGSQEEQAQEPVR